MNIPKPASPLYLDYAATTPVDPAVADAMMACLTADGNYGNPASRSHLLGWKAEEAVENARGQLATLLNADPREIVLTSGATESNNLAIKGAVEAHIKQHQCAYSDVHIVTSLIEHKAILDPCAHLAELGVQVSYLSPNADGITTPEALSAAIQDNTLLTSIMHVNNELGSQNDIAALGEVCRQHGALFHVDAAQSVGKLPIDLTVLSVDLLSISAHKFYGPKGAGALYVRRSNDVEILAQIHGGGHERGMRPGTLATHQIVGLGAAAEVAASRMARDLQHIQQLREQFLQGLSTLGGTHVNGSLEHHWPGIINVAFEGVEGETLLMSLRTLAISTGSACTSASVEPSYVLKALGLADDLAHSALRFSLGRETSSEDVERALGVVSGAVRRLRAIPR